MNKSLIALFTLCMCFSFSSCDEDDIKGLLPSFKVDINKTENITVHIDQTNGDRITFSEKTNFTLLTFLLYPYLFAIPELIPVIVWHS